MFEQIVLNLKSDTLGSLDLYLPEIRIIGTIVVLLFIRLFRGGREIWPSLIAIAGLIYAFLPCYEHLIVLPHSANDISAVAVSTNQSTDQTETGTSEAAAVKPALKEIRQPIFTGLLTYDRFTIFFRAFFILFTILLIILTQVTSIPDKENAADIYTLMLGSVVGMCIMVSADNLLMVFFGVEMASVPSYVLAGMLKGRKQASEAALKFAIYGAGAAGVMLYGISLLSGALGTADIPTMASQLAVVINDPALYGDRYFVLFLGGLMLMVGLAFKLSAVPFHFWAPDVFEGATAEVNAFLSVASKAAALGLLVRLAIGLGGESLMHDQVPTPVAANQNIIQTVAFVDDAKIENTSEQHASPEHASTEHGTPEHASTETASENHSKDTHAHGKTEPKTFHPLMAFSIIQIVRDYIVLLIGLLAAITATFGNLAAYGQTNIKRLLAYSTIAHAGYMMMAVAAAVQLMGNNPQSVQDSREAIAALLVYIATYLFMNLGAFAIVAIIRNSLRSEELSDYAGLFKSCPFISVCMIIILVSLVGIPPVAGFIAKFSIFAALWNAKLYTLLVIGGLNTVISLIYYLRVMKIIAIDPEPETRLPISIPMFSLRGAYVGLITAPLLLLMIAWEPLMRLSLTSVWDLFSVFN